jgi:hypothetical protein
MVLPICLLVLVSSSTSKADTVVSFTVGGAGGNFGPAYVEQGFSFTSPFVNVIGNQLHVTSSNTASPIVITFQGGAFDFLSFDYAFAGGFSGTTFTASNGATFTPLFPGVTYTLGSEFQNITSLTVTHFATPGVEGPTFNVYDNFRFQAPNPSTTAPVPEPTTIFMFGIGLAGVRALMRRHGKHGL